MSVWLDGQVAFPIGRLDDLKPNAGTTALNPKSYPACLSSPT